MSCPSGLGFLAAFIAGALPGLSFVADGESESRVSTGLEDRVGFIKRHGARVCLAMMVGSGQLDERRPVAGGGGNHGAPMERLSHAPPPMTSDTAAQASWWQEFVAVPIENDWFNRGW